MDTFLLGLAAATLLVHLASGIEFAIGNRSIRFLRDVAPPEGFAGPRVSVIIPARDEARKIAEALQSVLEQDYVDLEIIAVDDRSTDGTGVILDRMAQAHPGLKVIHLTELPQGWLGKNHALYLGTQHASGGLLLFTDADVVMAPSTISQAVSYMMGQHLDHLAVVPEIRMPGILLQVFIMGFAIFFGMYLDNVTLNESSTAPCWG